MNLEKIKNDPRMPKHIALIIDGNGRWAKRRGMPRSYGHEMGSENIKKHIKYVQELGIKNLSVYCFSKQNWNRPKEEIDYLMETFDKMLNEYNKEYQDKDVRIIISGDMDDERIPKHISQKAKELMEKTKNKKEFILNCCINYGGREEILNAINNIIKDNKKVVDSNIFDSYLYTYGMLPLDFIIRTSGEKRTSNFLLWQSTYSEWHFPKTLWPAFTKRDLIKALKVFMKRNRRFGAIKG